MSADELLDVRAKLVPSKEISALPTEPDGSRFIECELEPFNFTLPATSNFCPGSVVPMPTLPSSAIVIRVAPPVTSTNNKPVPCVLLIS